MTRINVVPPEKLFNLHILAEYRELPRVFTLAAQAAAKGSNWKRRQPLIYTMGPGHVLFFYDRLRWLAERHKLLVAELLARGYEPKFREDLYKKWRKQIPKEYWRDYAPDQAALDANWKRIHLRMKNTRWWKDEVPFLI